VTLRDRLVLTAVVVLAVLGAAWVLVVSPERKKASQIGGQVASAQAALSSAESKLDTARQAQARYSAAYASIVSLGKAVPTTQEVPSLIYQLSHVSKSKNVDFQSISVGSGSTPATSVSAASAAAAGAGFSQVAFNLQFNGSYAHLESLLREISDLATLTPSGALEVKGRLLTIQSVKLSQSTEGTGGGLVAAVTATAYQLPAETTAAAPAVGGTSTTSTSAGTSSPTAPAIVRVK
jgi:Tfp pilus assembly protein PilO